MTPAWLRPVADGVELRLKVVPGSSRACVAGPLGDRLKVRVAQPPEGGRANAAVEELLERLTGRPCRIASGHAAPLKLVLVQGGRPDAVATALGG